MPLSLLILVSSVMVVIVDVVDAIDDMEKLYNSFTEKGNLADDTFDFMKGELTVKDVVDIQTKIKFQPPSVGVTNHNVFPG